MSLENCPDLLLNISDTDVRPEEIHSYQFKSFILKPVERQLFDGDQQVSLTPKAFDVLTFLIENAGHLVAKEELMQRIWTESFVEEANLTRLVHTIRKTLGEDENGNKFIETVPTKGYRFVAEVEKVVVTPQEDRETFATDRVAEFWPDRLESAASVETEQITTPISEKKSASRWLFAGLVIIVVAGLVASFALWRNNTGSAAAKKQPIPSIAVLPFRPINTGERDLTYELAFANAVISYLDESTNLSASPFAVMRSYTDPTQDPIAIGNERGTDYVLDSNYLVHNRRWHVTSYLYNVKTGLVDKTFKYEFGNTDIYALGSSVAAKIAPDVLAGLKLAEVDRGTGNEEAWTSYLQGMALSNKRTVEDGQLAVTEFNNAIRLDPNYPRAYMGLAHALQTIYTNGGERDKYCGPAFEAEKKALELDPNLGDAMVMMATNRKICWYEIPESEELYQRAIAMDANSAHVRRFYAVNISSEKRFDEALEHLRIARELEPNNPFNEKLVGRVLFQARKYDEAIASCIKSKDLVPEVEQTSFIYMSYEMKKDYDKAFEWLLTVKQMDGESEDELNVWRKIYADSGWKGLLERRLERALEEEKTTDRINKRARLLEEITSLLVELGDYDRAFVYMDKAATSYSLYGGQMLVDPYLEPVRSDPRYKAILAKTWNSHGGNWQ